MKKAGKLLYVLYFAAVICIVGLISQIGGYAESNHRAAPADMHFAILMPAQGEDESGVRAAIRTLAEVYRLDVEIHEFATVADQKQMLRVLPDTEVDGVLFWPISVDDADYVAEMLELRAAEIPVVIVERDIARQTRSSFIGSGTTSDLMVLDQSLKKLNKKDLFVIANRFGSGNSQVVEWVLFQKTGWGWVGADEELPHDQKLRQLVQNPPEGYLATEWTRLEGEDARSLQLKFELIKLFTEADMNLFFSMDDTVSTAAISAKRSLSSDRREELQLLCYGETAKQYEDLENGVLNGLVTSRPDVSITIGIRYLRDICRGFWVPENMDSGIDFWESNIA